METIQRIVVAGILIEQGKILLVHRVGSQSSYPGSWELPSGEKQANEDCFNCLVRKIRKEVGISAYVDRPVSVFDYQMERGDTRIKTTQINFLTKRVDSRQHIRLSSVYRQYKYFDRDELDRCQINPAIKNVLTITFDNLANPARV
ncbi:MAG: NUDIX domain-containing protein [Patescibacteria group bacterium]